MINVWPKERKLVRPQLLRHFSTRNIFPQPVHFARSFYTLRHLGHSAQVIKVRLPVLWVSRRDHGRRARLHNRPVEQPVTLLHAHQVPDRNRAGRLACQGHPRGGPAKVGDVLLHPLESQDLILQTPIADAARRVGGGPVEEGVVELEFCGVQEAEVVGAVVGDDNDQRRGERDGSCYEIGCVLVFFFGGGGMYYLVEEGHITSCRSCSDLSLSVYLATEFHSLLVGTHPQRARQRREGDRMCPYCSKIQQWA